MEMAVTVPFGAVRCKQAVWSGAAVVYWTPHVPTMLRCEGGERMCAESGGGTNPSG